jgi:PAS domain S-box-containing protein
VDPTTLDAPVRRMFRVTGLVLLAVAAAVLIGRFTGQVWIVTLVPGGAPMAFATAIGFLLAGAAFAALAQGWRGRAQAAAGAVLALGLGTLLLYLAAETLEWRRFMFDPAMMAAGRGFDGRMSPNAAGSFATLGLALLLLARPPWRLQPLTLCATAIIAVAGTALLGYATGLRAALTWWRFTGMAVHTAGLLFLAAAAVIVAVMRGTPERRRPVLRTFQYFAAGAMVLVVIMVIVEASSAERDAAERWVRRSHEVKAGIERFIGATARADTAVRNFMLTSEDRYTGRLAAHRAAVQDALDTLARLTADNPAHTAHVAALRRLTAENFALKDGQIDARHEQGLDAALAALRAEPPALIQGLRAATDGMLAAEETLLQRREADTQRHIARLRWALGLGEAAGLVCMAAAFTLTLRTRERLLTVNDELAQRAAALRESEERFRQAFDYAGIGMAIVGLDGRWLRVNASLCDIVGYDEAALMTKTFQDITHPDDLAADLAHVRELLAGERRVYRMEKRYFHRAGHTIWIRLTASLVRDAQGAPLHFVSQIEDVTAQRRLEENLAEARDAALAASRLKSDFLANMSHELRTPMNAVVGMGGLLAATPLAPAQQEMVRSIRGGAESLLAIIDDLLDLAKIEAGKLRLEPADFDFRAVIEETVALLAPEARAKGVAVGCAFDPAPPPRLFGDGGRVRQVLTNLLGNAVKFTARGEIRIVVRTTAAAPGRIALRTEVRDTGVGIAPAAQARLFQPFMQEDASTTRRFGGTGLGLAISRQLVELMGGAIGCESAPGRGSVFWFEIAFAPGAAAPPTVAPAAPGRARRLLLVEDNPANQRVAALMLAQLGHEADLAASGHEALRRLAAGDYAAVLMDCQMPGLDGYETTRRIRAGALPGIDARVPIIALTAYALAGDRARCLAAGMEDHLAKPLRPAELAAALARCGLGGGGAAPPPPDAAQLPVLDVTVAETVRALPGRSGGSLLADLVRLRRAEAPERVARLRRLLAERTAEALVEEAHALGGTAAVLGGLRTRGAARALEEAARAGDWPAAAARLEALLAADADLDRALEELAAAAR